MHKPALFLAGISFAIVCASAFAQTLPIHPDTEIRTAMAWTFPARVGTLWQRVGQAAMGRLEEVFFATLCGFLDKLPPQPSAGF
ncbi:MAG: hypothetical protein ACTHJG_02260 [Rhodanobacteraceae bacterium]